MGNGNPPPAPTRANKLVALPKTCYTPAGIAGIALIIASRMGPSPEPALLPVQGQGSRSPIRLRRTDAAAFGAAPGAGAA